MIETLDRVTAEISRESEYMSSRELEIMTGMSMEHFGHVIIKELMDNSLDAAEKAGISPEIKLSVIEDGEKQYNISISDNGIGLTIEQLERMLDFSVRVSDKLIYRSPSRGSQGNAFKTIIGIPYALGIEKPVVIESCGKKLIIKAFTTPLQTVKIDKTISDSGITQGTKISLNIPKAIYYSNDIFYDKWAYAFSLFNPHLTLTYTKNGKKNEDLEDSNVYNISPLEEKIFPISYKFPDNWSKFTPTDKTSPYWYDVETLEKQIYSIVTFGNGKADDTLRRYIQDFRGLTSNSKAKIITGQFPGIFRLKDLIDRKDLIVKLHEKMKEQINPPKAAILGEIGEEHFRRSFNEWFTITPCDELKKNYAKIYCEGDIPYTIEAFLCKTEDPGNYIYYGMNFSPSYKDFLTDYPFDITTNKKIREEVYNSKKGKREKKWIDKKIKGWGLKSFITSCYFRNNTAIVLHLISPSITVLDRGKTHINISDEIKVKIYELLWGLCKDNFTAGYEEEEALKNKPVIDEDEEEEEEDLTLIAAVNLVMEEAYNFGTNNNKLPISARGLMYQVRPRIQQYTSQKLNDSYFTQNLLPAYVRAHPNKLERVYYEPKGYLVEPHRGVKKLPLGTKNVDSYFFPELLYDKILYIEKQGLIDVILQSRLPEKYDMAIVAAEGLSTVAARVLFEKADKQKNYKMFVLHDADPGGYTIARTLRESTKRMPDYSVNVIDIGLFIQDALDLGIEPETFYRAKALDSALELTEKEYEFFKGEVYKTKWDDKKNRERIASWKCKRIELNALSSQQLIDYIESKLEDYGATSKIIPEEKIKENLKSKFNEYARNRIETGIRHIFSLLDLQWDIYNKISETEDFKNFEPDATSIIEELQNNTTNHWKDFAYSPNMDKTINGLIETIDFKEEVINFVNNRVNELEQGEQS